MTDVDIENPTAEDVQPDRLVLVFAPSLWPFRSPLDRVSWELGTGIARLLSMVPGLVGYATPRALADPAAVDPNPGGIRPPLRVLRSLPPVSTVREEAASLGASWALTGRLLMDAEGTELWLNLLSGSTGDLLWTSQVRPRRDRLLWSLVDLLRSLLEAQGLTAPPTLSTHLLAPTGSWPALVAYTRARQLQEGWQGELSVAQRIIASASKAVALDPAFVEAAEFVKRVAEGLLNSATNTAVCEAVRDAIGPHPTAEVLVIIRRRAHERWLALAKGEGET
jgi:hypothetical protein